MCGFVPCLYVQDALCSRIQNPENKKITRFDWSVLHFSLYAFFCCHFVSSGFAFWLLWFTLVCKYKECTQNTTLLNSLVWWYWFVNYIHVYDCVCSCFLFTFWIACFQRYTIRKETLTHFSSVFHLYVYTLLSLLCFQGNVIQTWKEKTRTQLLCLLSHLRTFSVSESQNKKERPKLGQLSAALAAAAGLHMRQEVP